MLSIDEFDYELPEAAIAQTPWEPRDGAKLLDALGDEPEHRIVRDLPQLIRPGDAIVVNNTRVIPARLALQKTTGGAVEVMLLNEDVYARSGAGSSELREGQWRALVRPSRRVKPGTELLDINGQPAIEVGDDLGDGIRLVRSLTEESMLKTAHRVGTIPLPPYITSGYDKAARYADRYQTVYAEREASVAAPTAGLHFTPELLDACRAAGAKVHTVELAVGLGTFRPIMVEDVHQHQMHAEEFWVDDEVLMQLQDADRVIAVGTTSVRALESAVTLGEDHGATDLFISPGYRFGIVDVLFTNFHQPKSSLLVMLGAFAGTRWRDLYAEALAADYRFLSFGDAMIVGRHQEAG